MFGRKKEELKDSSRVNRVVIHTGTKDDRYVEYLFDGYDSNSETSGDNFHDQINESASKHRRKQTK